MLVPLETLQGWPAAPNPSALHFLLLLIGAPLVIGLVIAGASYLGSTRELKRYGPAVNPNTAFVSVAGVEHASGEVEGGISHEVPAGLEAKPGADTGTGGASARW
ncbi:hypothetical protein GCM10022204_06400 [Microlunatus aurantiacus]|uniref:Uncharacterized protein n=1 Tax=Microlunatus aurantiacus TaxID=446786 RepID=A0ABP7CS97_9ACTN